MAILNVDHYQENEDCAYSDGVIEEEIYQRVCDGDDTLAQDPRWAVFYHFSPLRQNILNWYPFLENCNILEIGAGCGALTGMLTQKASCVTACELTLRRAKINYQRHKDLPNLEIIVGDFARMELEPKYDYVVLNGVLEYAAIMLGQKVNDPYVRFLEMAKECLRPGGRILLAIENRFGLKYFAGAPEDHLGTPFSGINNYETNSTVRTFTKGRLEKIFARSGLHSAKWYYPFPDYKFPTEILSDTTINTMAPCLDVPPFDLPRASIFSERKAYTGLMENKISEYFSNSFLVELAIGMDMPSSTISYAKISNNRHKHFAICTVIDGATSLVEKRPLYQDGASHLQWMAARPWKFGALKSIPCHWDGAVLKYQYIKQKTLYEQIKQYLLQKRETDAWLLLKRLRDVLYVGKPTVRSADVEFQAVFGGSQVRQSLHWVQGLNIDLIAENIFPELETWSVIDHEWVFSFAIPAEYVLWRTMTQLASYIELQKMLHNEVVFSFLGIDKNTAQVFGKWETNFAEIYVGMHDLSSHRKAMVKIALEQTLEEAQRERDVLSHLFLMPQQEDEEPTMLQSRVVEENGVWIVRFDALELKNVAWLRWDPLEGHACKVTEIDAGALTCVALNAEADEEPFTFATFDPQFRLSGDFFDINRLEIKFKCELLDWTAGYFKRERELNSERSLRQHEEILHHQWEESAAQWKESAMQWERSAALLEVDLTRSETTASQTQAELSKAKIFIEQLQQREIALSKLLSQTENILAQTREESALVSKKLLHTQKDLSEKIDILNSTEQRLTICEADLASSMDDAKKLYFELERIREFIKTHPFITASRALMKKEI